MIVVVETNVLVSSYLSAEGPSVNIMDHWRKETFELLVSPPILEEYQRALKYEYVRKYHQLSDREIARDIEDIRALARFVRPTVTVGAIKAHPEDNKFLECAVSGGADYIVSGDSHLLGLGEYEGISVLSSRAFLTLLSTQRFH